MRPFARLAFMACLACVCLRVHAEQLIPEGAQAGDLVFREGTETISAIVLSVDGGSFSHVGMLVGRPGSWQVVHATPSEVPGRPDGVVVDPLAFFLSPARSSRHLVLAPQKVNSEQRARAVARALNHLGTRFSMTEPDGVYCTTLVWKAWAQAGLDFETPFTWLAIPLMNGDYLLPGVLAKSRHLARISPKATASVAPSVH